MLNLAPDIETRVREYAAAEGVSVEELIARAFPPRPRKPDEKASRLIKAIAKWQSEDATDDENERMRRDQETDDLHTRLDDIRIRAGMRPLFPVQD